MGPVLKVANDQVLRRLFTIFYPYIWYWEIPTDLQLEGYH